MNEEGAAVELKLALNPCENLLRVNGADITKHVKHVFMETDGKVTRFGIELTPLDVQIAGPGVVEVVRHGPPDVGPLLELLEGIDPEQLEQDALAGMTMGGDATVAILDAIKRYLSGGA